MFSHVVLVFLFALKQTVIYLAYNASSQNVHSNDQFAMCDALWFIIFNFQ